MTAITRRLLVKVQQFDGTIAQVIGRSAAMIMWVVIYHDRINDTFRGTVSFEWEGASLRPQFQEKFDRINVDNLLPLSDESSTHVA